MICDDQASRRLCLRRYGYERPEWAGRHRLRLRHADEREAYSPRLRLQCDTPPRGDFPVGSSAFSFRDPSMGMNDHHAGAVPGHLNRALQYQGRTQQGKGIHHQHGGRQGTQPIAHRSGRLGRDIGTQGGDEQPVRVHAIWRARHQGDAILACDDSEFRHIGRFITLIRSILYPRVFPITVIRKTSPGFNSSRRVNISALTKPL